MTTIQSEEEHEYDPNGQEKFSLMSVSLSLYLLALCGAALFGQFDIFFSTLFGGSVALLNLAALKRFAQAVLGPNSPGVGAARGLVMFSFYLRLTLFTATLYCFILLEWIHFPALASGLSITVGGVFVWYLLTGRKLENNVKSRKKS